MQRDHTKLLAELTAEYQRYSPKSAALNATAKAHMVDGGNHALRLMQPFPPRIVAAQGAYVQDEDGHRILDFWQGHYANILGHNPAIVSSVLADAFESRRGLQTGFTDRLQVETAEILCRQTGAERVRFTTSGALATMYAIMLGGAFTQRNLVMKIGGGWHGGQPWGLKGSHFQNGHGFDSLDSAGLAPGTRDQVLITRFNDPAMLEKQFRQYGDKIAGFIVEPFIGAGGSIPATREYLQTARRLTQQYGAVLIFDEVISGFRFRAGDAGALFGVKPDLATFAKAIGGGMPVAAVAGRADIMNLVGRGSSRPVAFSGGTYSGHPAAMLAAKTFMTYLVEHEAEIYPRLAALGQKTRQTIVSAFTEEGIYAYCTGKPNDAITGISLAMLFFPYQAGRQLERPDDTRDPDVCDLVLSEKVLPIAMLLENVHVVHGLGAVSTAHTEADIDRLGEVCRRVARRFRS
ncbi:MAG: aminotransferase class III-fold pyridoxal phosphate-dependent enzyme [Chloroflexi bacterium]|nr:aminotransferase class III-fold pyridoxal phosphate-dependent enzyme [Chloroflexota bacterium]